MSPSAQRWLRRMSSLRRLPRQRAPARSIPRFLRDSTGDRSDPRGAAIAGSGGKREPAARILFRRDRRRTLENTDGGVTWRPVSDKDFKTRRWEPSPSRSRIRTSCRSGWVTELRGNILQGDGVYKSADGGKTWAHIGLEKTMAIRAFASIRRTPTSSTSRRSGDPYGPNAERGVFKSIDGGKTWTRSLFRNDKTGAIDLSLDTKNPETLTPACGRSFARLTRFRAAARAVDSSRPRMEEGTGSS